MQSVFELVLESDLFVLATPIYSWYRTPPMKAALDRLVSGMNKFYGGADLKECLWEGKKCALLATADIRSKRRGSVRAGYETVLQTFQLDYIGMLAVRTKGYRTEFMDDETAVQARQFAERIVSHFLQV
jgi:multimeric flavodoxin WrbA